MRILPLVNGAFERKGEVIVAERLDDVVRASFEKAPDRASIERKSRVIRMNGSPYPPPSRRLITYKLRYQAV